MFNIISKIIDFLSQSIAAIGIAGGVAIAFTNVVARYAFDASLVWATELSVFLFLWSAFFAAVYCFKKDAHIAVTIVIDVVPTKALKPMLLISYAITMIFLIAVSYYGYEYLILVEDIDERSIDLWDMPMWIVYLVIPISFAFSAYRVAEKMIYTIKTPHYELKRESEAQSILQEMSKENKDIDSLVKDVEKKTGGML